MKVENIEKNTLLYCAPYRVIDPIDDCFQIYNIQKIKLAAQFSSDPYELRLTTIIGPYDFDLCVPKWYDLDNLLLVKHNSNLWMVYSTNEEKVVDYYRRYINNEQYIFDKVWNDCSWKWESVPE